MKFIFGTYANEIYSDIHVYNSIFNKYDYFFQFHMRTFEKKVISLNLFNFFLNITFDTTKK